LSILILYCRVLSFSRREQSKQLFHFSLALANTLLQFSNAFLLPAFQPGPQFLSEKKLNFARKHFLDSVYQQNLDSFHGDVVTKAPRHRHSTCLGTLRAIE
jgi:hypothetical protein